MPPIHTHTHNHTQTQEKPWRCSWKLTLQLKLLLVHPWRQSVFNMHDQNRKESVCFEKRQTVAYTPSEITQSKTNAPQLHTIRHGVTPLLKCTTRLMFCKNSMKSKIVTKYKIMLNSREVRRKEVKTLPLREIQVFPTELKLKVYLRKENKKKAWRFPNILSSGIKKSADRNYWKHVHPTSDKKKVFTVLSVRANNCPCSVLPTSTVGTETLPNTTRAFSLHAFAMCSTDKRATDCACMNSPQTHTKECSRAHE